MAAALIGRLDDELAQALHGSRLAARQYVSTWRSLRDAILNALQPVRPDDIVLVGQHLMLRDSTGSPSATADDCLDLLALQAPLTSWVTAYGLGTGAAAALLAGVRSCLPNVPALNPPSTAAPVPDMDPAVRARFLRIVFEELRADKTPLKRVMEIFELNQTECGRLFGVSRQAILQWIDESVPASRMGKLGTVLATAELLERKLRVGRVPLAARRPAPAYGGRTMLEMIEADQHEDLHRLVSESFDWSGTA